MDPTRARNRLAVLSALRRVAGGALSRTALSAHTGLSNAAISSLTGEMIEHGLLCPREGARAGGRGRPQAPLGPAPQFGSVLSVMIDGRETLVFLDDYAGAALIEIQGPAPAAGDAGDLAAHVARLLRARLGPSRLPPLRQVVLCAPGVMEAGREGVRMMPGMRGPVRGLAPALSEVFGVPAALVGVAEALALTVPAPALLVVLGPELDAALAGDGAPVLIPGGFGHLNYRPGGAVCACGARGCVAAHAGDAAIWRTARGQAPMRRPDAIADLAAAARSGEPSARGAFVEAGRALGHALGAVSALIGPAPVVLAGAGAGARDLLEPGLQEGWRAAAPAFLPAPLETRLLEPARAPMSGIRRAALAAADAAAAAHRPDTA